MLRQPIEQKRGERTIDLLTLRVKVCSRRIQTRQATLRMLADGEEADRAASAQPHYLRGSSCHMFARGPPGGHAHSSKGGIII